jgi:hypothetical protein
MTLDCAKQRQELVDEAHTTLAVEELEVAATDDFRSEHDTVHVHKEAYLEGPKTRCAHLEEVGPTNIGYPNFHSGHLEEEVPTSQADDSKSHVGDQNKVLELPEKRWRKEVGCGTNYDHGESSLLEEQAGIRTQALVVVA